MSQKQMSSLILIYNTPFSANVWAIFERIQPILIATPRYGVGQTETEGALDRGSHRQTTVASILNDKFNMTSLTTMDE